jgi:Leucine-rich repeat (LRR) protein
MTLGLRTLKASHNKLQSIGLSGTPAIQSIDLDNNYIKDIKGLSLAYNLEFLSLREQKEASDIVELVLTTPNECRHIRISSNAVTNGTFSLPPLPQSNLRELEIAACGISELPERFGAYFPNCRVLNANFNAIKELVPLRGMAKLRQLFIAKNRVHRLRRTCLLLSRLTFLEHVDLRDNPLTVGFYSPVFTKGDDHMAAQDKYHLPHGSPKQDRDWTKLLDEMTKLRKRTLELLLGEHCKKLTHLDGQTFCRESYTKEDGTWNRLTATGVLAIPVPEAVEKSVEEANEHVHECEDEQDTRPVYATG